MQAQMSITAAFVTDIFNLLKQWLQENAKYKDLSSREGILADMIRHPEEYAEVSAVAGESSQRLKEILEQNNVDYEILPGNPAYGKDGGIPDQFILHIKDLQQLIDEGILVDDSGHFTKSYDYSQDAYGQSKKSGQDNASRENGYASDREKDASAFSEAESTDREQEEDAFGRTQEERKQDESGEHEASFFGGQAPDFEEDLSKNLRTGRNGTHFLVDEEKKQFLSDTDGHYLVVDPETATEVKAAYAQLEEDTSKTQVSFLSPDEPDFDTSAFAEPAETADQEHPEEEAAATQETEDKQDVSGQITPEESVLIPSADMHLIVDDKQNLIRIDENGYRFLVMENGTLLLVDENDEPILAAEIREHNGELFLVREDRTQVLCDENGIVIPVQDPENEDFAEDDKGNLVRVSDAGNRLMVSDHVQLLVDADDQPVLAGEEVELEQDEEHLKVVHEELKKPADEKTEPKERSEEEEDELFQVAFDELDRVRKQREIDQTNVDRANLEAAEYVKQSNLQAQAFPDEAAVLSYLNANPDTRDQLFQLLDTTDPKEAAETVTELFSRDELRDLLNAPSANKALEKTPEQGSMFVPGAESKAVVSQEQTEHAERKNTEPAKSGIPSFHGREQKPYVSQLKHQPDDAANHESALETRRRKAIVQRYLKEHPLALRQDVKDALSGHAAQAISMVLTDEKALQGDTLPDALQEEAVSVLAAKRLSSYTLDPNVIRNVSESPEDAARFLRYEREGDEDRIRKLLSKDRKHLLSDPGKHDIPQGALYPEEKHSSLFSVDRISGSRNGDWSSDRSGNAGLVGSTVNDDGEARGSSLTKHKDNRGHASEKPENSIFLQKEKNAASSPASSLEKEALLRDNGSGLKTMESREASARSRKDYIAKKRAIVAAFYQQQQSQIRAQNLQDQQNQRGQNLQDQQNLEAAARSNNARSYDYNRQNGYNSQSDISGSFDSAQAFERTKETIRANDERFAAEAELEQIRQENARSAASIEEANKTASSLRASEEQKLRGTRQDMSNEHSSFDHDMLNGYSPFDSDMSNVSHQSERLTTDVGHQSERLTTEEQGSFDSSAQSSQVFHDASAAAQDELAQNARNVSEQIPPDQTSSGQNAQSAETQNSYNQQQQASAGTTEQAQAIQAESAENAYAQQRETEAAMAAAMASETAQRAQEEINRQAKENVRRQADDASVSQKVRAEEVNQQDLSYQTSVSMQEEESYRQNETVRTQAEQSHAGMSSYEQQAAHAAAENTYETAADTQNSWSQAADQSYSGAMEETAQTQAPSFASLRQEALENAAKPEVTFADLLAASERAAAQSRQQQSGNTGYPGDAVYAGAAQGTGQMFGSSGCSSYDAKQQDGTASSTAGYAAGTTKEAVSGADNTLSEYSAAGNGAPAHSSSAEQVYTSHGQTAGQKEFQNADHSASAGLENNRADYGAAGSVAENASRFAVNKNPDADLAFIEKRYGKGTAQAKEAYLYFHDTEQGEAAIFTGAAGSENAKEVFANRTAEYAALKKDFLAQQYPDLDEGFRAKVYDSAVHGFSANTADNPEETQKYLKSFLKNEFQGEQNGLLKAQDAYTYILNEKQGAKLVANRFQGQSNAAEQTQKQISEFSNVKSKYLDAVYTGFDAQEQRRLFDISTKNERRSEEKRHHTFDSNTLYIPLERDHQSGNGSKGSSTFHANASSCYTDAGDGRNRDIFDNTIEAIGENYLMRLRNMTSGTGMPQVFRTTKNYVALTSLMLEVPRQSLIRKSIGEQTQSLLHDEDMKAIRTISKGMRGNLKTKDGHDAFDLSTKEGMENLRAVMVHMKIEDRRYHTIGNGKEYYDRGGLLARGMDKINKRNMPYHRSADFTMAELRRATLGRYSDKELTEMLGRMRKAASNNERGLLKMEALLKTKKSMLGWRTLVNPMNGRFSSDAIRQADPGTANGLWQMNASITRIKNFTRVTPKLYSMSLSYKTKREMQKLARLSRKESRILDREGFRYSHLTESKLDKKLEHVRKKMNRMKDAKHAKRRMKRGLRAERADRVADFMQDPLKRPREKLKSSRDDAVKSAKARLKDTSFGRKLKTVQLKRRVLHEKFLKSKLGGRLHAIISAVNDLVNNRMVFWNLLKQKIMQKILGYVLPYIIQVAVIMIVSCIVISFSVSALGFVWSMFTNPIDGTAYGSQEGVITQDQGNRDLDQPEVPTPND